MENLTKTNKKPKSVKQPTPRMNYLDDLTPMFKAGDLVQVNKLYINYSVDIEELGNTIYEVETCYIKHLGNLKVCIVTLLNTTNKFSNFYLAYLFTKVDIDNN